MKKRIHLNIRGRVQGVGFRMYAMEEAERLGLTGWVRNQYDSSVEAVAEGTEVALKEFEQWCSQGPPAARVTGADANYSNATGEFDSFTVAY